MSRIFTMEYWLDDDWYVGRLKEVPGVFSQGETLQELEENLRDAYEIVLEENKGELPVHVKVAIKEIEVRI